MGCFRHGGRSKARALKYGKGPCGRGGTAVCLAESTVMLLKSAIVLRELRSLLHSQPRQQFVWGDLLALLVNKPASIRKRNSSCLCFRRFGSNASRPLELLAPQAMQFLSTTRTQSLNRFVAKAQSCRCQSATPSLDEPPSPVPLLTKSKVSTPVPRAPLWSSAPLALRSSLF